MKNKNGVSIIILVVTVITMAILAGVAVTFALKENPINATNKQVFLANMSVMQERLDETMADMERKDSNFSRENIFTMDITEKQKYIPKVPAKYLDKVIIEFGRIAIDKSKLTRKELAYIQESKVAIKAPYYNPPVPSGFTAMDTKDKWNSGFRIKDANGNIYVWIPVMMLNGRFANGAQTTHIVDVNTMEHNKAFGVRDYTDNEVIQTNLHAAVQASTATSTEKANYKQGKIAITDVNAKIPDVPEITYAKMVENVEKYGGFYISAYEIGWDTTNNRQVSRQGEYPNPADNEDVAQYIDGENGYSSVHTFLPTTSHYDSLFAWLNATGKKSKYAIEKDSRSWGVYMKPGETRSMANTGTTPHSVVANIYDLAGNRWELTQGHITCKGAILEPTATLKLHRGGSVGESLESKQFAANAVYAAQDTIIYPDPGTNQPSKTLGGYRACLYIK